MCNNLLKPHKVLAHAEADYLTQNTVVNTELLQL